MKMKLVFPTMSETDAPWYSPTCIQWQAVCILNTHARPPPPGCQTITCTVVLTPPILGDHRKNPLRRRSGLS